MSGRSEPPGKAFSSAPHPADAELLRDIRQERVQALEQAMSRYWAPLYRFVFGMLGRADPSEEVVQQCFVNLWERRKALDSEGSLAGLLYRMARNLALNMERNRTLRAERERACEEETTLGRSHADPEQDLEREMIRRGVTAALEDLSPRRREVFVLAKFHELSRHEIAEALELAPQTVANHLSAAVDQLRESLRPLFSGTGKSAEPSERSSSMR